MGQKTVWISGIHLTKSFNTNGLIQLIDNKVDRMFHWHRGNGRGEVDGIVCAR